MKNLLTLTLALATCSVFAQTGPGGVGNSSNNVIWLDASRLSLNNGDPVSSWTDFSGNGNHFTQATVSRQPVFVTSAVNALPSIYFNGDYVESSAISALNNVSSTHYLVTKSDNNLHIGAIFSNRFTSGTVSGVDDFFGTYLTTAGNQFKTFTRNAVGLQLNVNLGYLNTYNVLSSVISSGNSSISGYFNNNILGSTNGYNTSPNGHIMSRVGANTKALGDFYKGHVAEVIVYNTALNSAQNNIVSNYLAAKYRRNISIDLFAHELTHYREVFGVGQETDGGNYTAQGTGIVEFSNPTLADGDYIIAGHNNLATTSTTNDIPVALAGAARLQRIWRVTTTGTPSTLDVTFDVSTTVFNLDTEFTLVVESNDGVFANGGTTEYGPVTKVGNLVTFTGVSLPNNAYFTLFGPSPGIESVKTGNWQTASTWNCNCIPNQIDDVTIKSGHNVTVNLTSSITDITVEAGATLTLGASRTLKVYGNFDFGGTFTASTGTVTFAGTGTQTFTNTSVNPFTMYNFFITGGSTVELYTGAFEVSQGLRVTSGHLTNVSGSITLLSNSSSTAFINQSVPNAFTGEFIIQRFISARNASWGDLSSPVSNSTLGDWDSNPSKTQAEILMCGVNGISGSCGGWESVYLWEELFQDYVAITDTTYPLVAGQAVELWLEDTNSVLFDKTFDTRGTPNSGNIVVPVSNSWNLVGNPYAAFVTWTSLTKPTLNSTYYIWNTNTASYDAKTNGSIPPHQGFWVESTGSGNLTFTESSKYVTNSSTFFKQESTDDEPYAFLEAKLKITNPTLNYSHELKLRLNELAKVELDEFDASFLPSRIAEAPSITAYNKNATKHLAINSFNNEQEVVVPITIKTGVDGKHILNAIDFKSLEDKYQFIYLIDSKTTQTFNLKEISEIELKLTSSEEDNRFELRLSNSKAAANTNSAIVNIYKNQENTVIEFENPDDVYTISIVNVLGQKIINDFVNVSGNNFIIPNDQLTQGINIISVRSRDQTFIEKLNY